MGFKLVSGSWKIMVIRSPRILCISRSEIDMRSRPLNLIFVSEPTVAFSASILITALAVTDLPEPLSPTIANVSPPFTTNELP